MVPAQYRVLVTHRPKLACGSWEGSIVQSPAPPRLIEGGIPIEALVAHVAVARYADDQNRQTQMMARQGVLLDRSMLAFWMGYAAAEIAPVVARLREIEPQSHREAIQYALNHLDDLERFLHDRRIQRTSYTGPHA